MEQYRKSIQQKDTTRDSNAQCSVDLRADHSSLSERDPLSITAADIHESVSSMKRWAAPGPDIIHAYWLKKLIYTKSLLMTAGTCNFHYYYK